jgi:class I fructose-bisphosphate aldolase
LARPEFSKGTDVANIYGVELPEYLFSYLIDDAVEQAIAMDAAAVVVNLLRLPNQPELHHQCVKNIAHLKPQCERAGMPLIVEPLVMRDNSEKGGYMVDGDIDKILPLVRQACELGADIIKADPCDNVGEYHRVIQIAGRPVLPRGGGKEPEKEVLQRTFDLMKQGAKGIVYGRNIIQHENPSAMIRALMAIVHDGVSANHAMAILHG